ncbi:MAG: hypothetical protein E6I42_08545 [Chloroflexi bacterium]|nr:MAG: hypothetical protein E6I42_08545 [Chloroflexota bacterium]
MARTAPCRRRTWFRPPAATGREPPTPPARRRSTARPRTSRSSCRPRSSCAGRTGCWPIRPRRYRSRRRSRP